MTARADSVANKVTQYFVKHPDAVPSIVASKFGASKGNVYAYRKRARAQLDGREAKVFFSKKTVDEALTPEQVPGGVTNGNGDGGGGCVTPTKAEGVPTGWFRMDKPAPQTATYADSWVNHGTFLSRDEYRGYLRGRVVDLMRDGLKDNFDEAMRCADKLTQLARAEGQ